MRSPGCNVDARWMAEVACSQAGKLNSTGGAKRPSLGVITAIGNSSRR